MPRIAQWSAITSIIILTSVGCASTRRAPAVAPSPAGPPPACEVASPTLTGPTCDETHPLQHEMLQGVLWMQKSAEYRANALQAFQVATRNLEAALAKPRTWTDAVPPLATTPKNKFAVIVDIDETLLDNSPAEVAAMANQCHKFDKPLWLAWEKLGKADAIRGAREFLEAVAARNVAIFYVSNRSSENRTELIDNLRNLKLPMPQGPESVRLEKDCDKPSKECRRQAIVKDFRVLISVGDDLGDFVDVSGKSLQQRTDTVDANAARWGREWVILPNPIYGSWDRAFYDPSADSGATVLTKKCKALQPPTP